MIPSSARRQTAPRAGWAAKCGSTSAGGGSCSAKQAAPARIPSPNRRRCAALAAGLLLLSGPGRGQPIPLPANQLGIDGSAHLPPIGPVQTTFAASPSRTGFYVQNQCLNVGSIEIILDHAAGAPTIIIVGQTSSGPLDWSMARAGIRHTGQIRIAADPSCQFAAAEW